MLEGDYVSKGRITDLRKGFREAAESSYMDWSGA